MCTPETEPIEQPQHVAEPQRPVTIGAVTAVAACLAAAWIAAGPVGLLADPLRRVLMLLALAVALLSPGICDSRAWRRIVLTPWVAGAVAYAAFLALPTGSVMAAALVLAFLALVAAGQNRRALAAAATAVAVLGLFHFSRTSIPWFWLGADHAGRSLAHLAGAASSRPLNTGATFAGLDYLIVMVVLWLAYVRSNKPPRSARAWYGFAAIAAGHTLYLVLLSFIPGIAAAVAHNDSQAPSFLTGLLHAAIPWNVPVVLCVIDLVIVAAMLRWPAWGPPADRPAGSTVARLTLAVAALGMATLLPAITLLHTEPPTASGKKIVLYEKGFLNWLKPTHDSYGRLSSGMYGMLPGFVESLGAQCVVSPELSAEDLKDADALVLIFPDQPWSDEQLDRIDRFVRSGGSLLVMGEHTTSDPNGNNRFNEVLAATAMRVQFDSATFAVGGWLDSYEAIAHPATIAIADDRNQFGVVIGASVAAKWPARPLLAGRWGWADPGDETSDRAQMGNGRYDAGEKLGDLVLAAEQPLGKGRVVVFGDTSGISNGINVSSHVFNSRLFAYLVDGRNAHPAWRQLGGMLIAAFLIGLLLRRTSLWRITLVAVGLAASLTFCLSLGSIESEILPDGRLKSPNNLAYIDTSGLPVCSGESWRPDGSGGLVLTLMRNEYMPLTLDKLTPQRLERAGLLICGARAHSYSQADVQAIEQFVTDGGILILTVGYDRGDASMPLLEQLGFTLEPDDGSEPAPLGHFKSPYLESESRRVYVRFHAAWPIRCADPSAQVIAYGRDNQPVILLRRLGAGKVVLIGDTFFASNQNLEREDGTPFEGLRENADFWHWLIALLRDEQVWVPEVLGAGPTEEVTP